MAISKSVEIIQFQLFSLYPPLALRGRYKQKKAGHQNPAAKDMAILWCPNLNVRQLGISLGQVTTDPGLGTIEALLNFVV